MNVAYRVWFLYFVANFLLGMSTPLWAQSTSFGNNTGGLLGLGGAAEDIVKISAQFSPPTAKQPARLFITSEIKPGWHIYSITQLPGGPVRTQIKLNQSPQYRLLGQFQSLKPPKKEKEPEAFGDLVVESHYGAATWHAPLQLSPGVDPAKLKIEGQITVQPCNASTCLPPRQLPFTAVLGPGMQVPQEQLSAVQSPDLSSPAGEKNQASTFKNGSTIQSSSPMPPDNTAAATELPWRPYTATSFKQLMGPKFDPELLTNNLRSRLQTSDLWREMVLGFIGGIILNLMPCVLPVIGLKIFSFVQQSGQNRLWAFSLNILYAAGLISVFLLLAALAVFANLGWGQLFRYPAFNVAMAAVVFVMGLNFLGVWEFPIPGFIGSGKTAELAEREGLAGAFAKGVVTTILATPCTGPFMASALAWAVSQPPKDTFLVFFSVGLGMASPYLLIGAFPQLINFLPKPGAWMDTFKHVMGFVLMATVVYIFTFLDWPYIVPTIGLLMSFWAGCWWIGRTPLYAGFDTILRTWLQAAAFVGIMWILLFPGLKGLSGDRINWGGLYDVMNSRLNESHELRIQRHLEDLNQKGYQLVYSGRVSQPENNAGTAKTILVDFTADWCATCKTLEATILNTQAVRQKVQQNGVVMMKADWTREELEVTAMLDLLGARSVPTLAIFPADRPNDPIIFRGWYSQQ
ncbi:MAG TPA: cytochrome c biogenesis protein CcdA, partial [Thermoguttaceae bacterium]